MTMTVQFDPPRRLAAEFFPPRDRLYRRAGRRPDGLQTEAEGGPIGSCPGAICVEAAGPSQISGNVLMTRQR
jgi:hypothetical protein